MYGPTWMELGINFGVSWFLFSIDGSLHGVFVKTLIRSDILEKDLGCSRFNPAMVAFSDH